MRGYQNTDADEGEGAENECEVEEIDLCSINPQLEEFRKYIKAIGSFRLSSSLNSESLDFFIEEEWWFNFMLNAIKAMEKIQEEKEKIHSSRKAKLEAKQIEVIKQVKNLINDKGFKNLSTQRAMLNYAEENIPGIEILDPKELKRLVQILSDKLNG